MPHPFAANAAVSHLDTTPVAYNTLEFRALILAAGTLPVPLRTKDPFAEQTVLLRTISAVIDRLGLANLAEGPAPNIIGAGKTDLYRTVIIYAIVN